MSSKSSNTSKAAARTAKAAELRAAQEQAEKRRRLLMIGGVAALFLLIIGGAIAVTILNQKDVDAPGAGEGEYGVTIGDADADHEIVIYEDFLCPFCGQLEQTVGDQLDAAVEAGEVNVEYRPLPFLARRFDYSMEAANAFAVVLDESGPEVAKEFHDILFENQPSESGPFPNDDELVEWAVEAGADEDAVRPGIEDLAFEGWVDAAGDAASDADVSSTPTVLVDGEVVEGETLQDIAAQMVG